MTVRDELHTATLCLPIAMRQIINHYPKEFKNRIEEIRLRIQQPLSVTIGGKEHYVLDSNGKKILVKATDLSFVLDIITHSSIHSAMESMKQGFLTMEGGHRVGLCATAVMHNGEISALRSFSSLCIRIAREYSCCSDEIYSSLFSAGFVCNTCIISPPGYGKTTLLRDIIRRLSLNGIRIGVVDERGELAGMSGGIPQFDLGPRCDVISNAPKKTGLMMLLKTMSPDVICSDEITAEEDSEALIYCANCGVKILCTIHSSSVDEMCSRPVGRGLLNAGIFQRAVVIERSEGMRKYKIVELK